MTALVVAAGLIALVGEMVFLEYIVIGLLVRSYRSQMESSGVHRDHLWAYFAAGWRLTDIVNPHIDDRSQ